jgi:hypothetical protein
MMTIFTGVDVFSVTSVDVLETNDIVFSGVSQPDLHDAGWFIADTSHPMGCALRDEDLLVGFGAEFPFSHCDFEAGIQYHPEFTAVAVVLKAQALAGINRDDLDAAGFLVGKGSEFSPWSDVLLDPAAEFFFIHDR